MIGQCGCPARDPRRHGYSWPCYHQPMRPKEQLRGSRRSLQIPQRLTASSGFGFCTSATETQDRSGTLDRRNITSRASSWTRHHKELHMTTVRSIAVTGVLACWVVLLAGSIANGQTKTIPGEMVTTTVTVEAIEQSTRTLTVKNDKGIYETIQAGPDVTRFSEVKVGDKITVATTTTWSFA